MRSGFRATLRLAAGFVSRNYEIQGRFDGFARFSGGRRLFDLCLTVGAETLEEADGPDQVRVR